MMIEESNDTPVAIFTAHDCRNQQKMTPKLEFPRKLEKNDYRCEKEIINDLCSFGLEKQIPDWKDSYMVCYKVTLSVRVKCYLLSSYKGPLKNYADNEVLE